MSDPLKLTVVTATTNLSRAAECLRSWNARAVGDFDLVIVANGAAAASGLPENQRAGQHVRVLSQPGYLGTVPAFKLGCDAVEMDTGLVACFHDDLLIEEDGWDDTVREHFRRHPQCGLAGFSGAIGLGSDQLYKEPYQPYQLARIGFRSNLIDAEVHGLRSRLAERVACLDSFSMIFRLPLAISAWSWMQDHGMVHHFHDGAAACLAARGDWETWYVPVACTHYGGRTAVGDSGYQEWAKRKNPQGDQGFWQEAHAICYSEFRDVLPLRV